jgi:hypothetical protein
LPEAYKVLRAKLSDFDYDAIYQEIHVWYDYRKYGYTDDYTWADHQDACVGIKTGVANGWVWHYGGVYGIGKQQFKDMRQSCIDFNKKIRLIFWISKAGNDPQSVAWFDLMAVDLSSVPIPYNPPSLADHLGFGVRVNNLTLVGESCGLWGYSTVDLGVTLEDGGYPLRVEIIHYPAEKIEWYVNGVLKATQTNPNYIPSGESSLAGNVVINIQNGSTGGVPLYLHISLPLIIQLLSPPPTQSLLPSTLTLESGEDYVYSLAVSGGYLYAGLPTSPGKIVKIDLSTFTKVGTLTLSGVDEDYVYSLAVSGGYLYAGLYCTPPGKIVKIDLSTFTKVGTLSLGSGEDYVYSLAVSGGYLYAGLDTSPGKIVKIDLSTFTKVATLTLSAGENYVESLAVSGGYLYAGLPTSPGKVVKIDLSTFTEVGTLTLASGENNVYSLAVSGGYLYAGLSTSPGKIVKIDLSTFTKVATLTLSAGENYVYSLTFSADGYLYAGLYTSPGKIVKVDPSTFTKVGTLTLSAGENYVYSLTFSADGYLYAGLETSPGKIVKAKVVY